MNPCDPILFRELPVIQKIIQDETWLEGERRGCHVRPDDRVVRDRVCEIILRIGQQLRDTVTASCDTNRTLEREGAAGSRGDAATVIPLPGPNANEAA